MNFRTTFILSILLAAALVVVFVGRHRGENEPNPSSAFDTKGKKLFDEKTDSITRLVINSSDASAKPVELDKIDGKWRLASPINWSADEFDARGLVDSIVDLRSVGGVELNDANLSSTGLDHPRYTVQASSTDGKAIRLQIGARSTLGNDLYVRAGDEKGGELVAGGSLSDKLDKGLDKLAESLRDKQLVKTSSTEVHQLEINHKGHKLVLDKEGENWKIVEPSQAPAESTEVSDLLFSVTGLRADEFVDPQSPQAADADFDRPKAVVWFSSTAPAVPSTQPASAPTTRPAGVTVTFGQFSNVDRDKIYVRLSDPNVVATVAMTPSTLDRLTGASVLTLRDKKVIDTDPNTVSSFTLAVDRPPATQPTTRPAEQYEYTIARRKEAFGPQLPPVEQPTTNPAIAVSEPTTQPALATTQPTTQPTTATTRPSTQPAFAATLPAPPPPASKWVFQSGGSGDADDAQVDALLNALHPLKADKYLDKAPTTQPAGTYTLTVHAGPANGKGPQDYTVRLTSPGPTGSATGSYNDLVFETDRAILEKLDATLRKK